MIFLISAIATLLYVTSLYAQQLPDADWLAYFGARHAEPTEYMISTVSPFGSPLEFRQQERPKGTVSIDGREYTKSVLVHDSGPLANQTMETFIRVSEDGLYQRLSNGREFLLVPRPLAVGQTWSDDKGTLKFEGIENFETYKDTIPACLKITAISQESGIEEKSKEVRTETKYYQRGIGLIYKNESGGVPFTKILSRYAAPADSPHK